jgi:hypothetical protein
MPMGMVPMMTSHAHVRVALRHAAAERAEPRRQHLADALAEEDHDRELGAELRDGGERRSRVAAHEEPRDAEVRAGGDGEELGQALDEAQDDRLEIAQTDAPRVGWPTWGSVLVVEEEVPEDLPPED